MAGEAVHNGPCVVIAAGGSYGHIGPGIAFADAVRRIRPDARIIMLGTERGLEVNLVPKSGYQLELIPPVPMPRKPTPELLRLPLKIRDAVRATKDVLTRHSADVVIGFGGYVSLPAYLAARGRVPIVVHEANARAGLANKVGARFAERVFAAVPGSGLSNAKVIGIPLRQSITTLDRAGLRAEARAHFGLDPHAPTLLVFGGSQGARSINNAISAAAPQLAAAGIGVLHAYGAKNTIAVQAVSGAPAYVAVPYLERMDLAYAAADAALCRSGAMTVAELSALGLPAAFVPLPIGNGEQRLNAQHIIDAGGGLMVADEELSPQWIVDRLVPLLRDPERLAKMAAAAQTGGHAEADIALARQTLELVRR